MSQQLDKILATIKNIAPFPQVAVRAMKLNRSGDLTPGAIVEVIETDPGISAAVLREANSAQRGAAEPCTSLRDAGNQLGTRALNRILMKACAADCFGGLGDATPRSNRSLWNETVVTACSARFLALTNPEVEADMAYTVGLLQNIGHIVLDRHLGDARSEIMHITQPAPDAAVDSKALLLAERKVLGTDHAELGGRLAKLWGFPDELVDAIAFHHEPEKARDPELASVCDQAEELTWKLLSNGRQIVDSDGSNPFESLLETLTEEGILMA